MKKSVKDNIVELLQDKGRENPLLDEAVMQQNIITQMTEVDMMRTKTIFGMFVDGLQYLALQSEGDPKKEKQSEQTENARALLGHFFNVLDRAAQSLTPKTSPPPTKKIYLARSFTDPDA